MASENGKEKTALVAIQKQLQSPGVVKALAAASPDTLAKYLTPERVTRMVLSAASRTPLLLKCTPVSIAKAAADAVRLGLEPCGALQHAYLVPYFNGRLSAYEAQFIPGYRGYAELARRSGKISDVMAAAVFERDDFDFDFASLDRPKHRPYLGKEGRGDFVGAYTISTYKDSGGEHHKDFMTLPEIIAVRDKMLAKIKKKESSPWTLHFVEMARKTVFRRSAKYLPLSVELAEVLEYERRIEAGEFTDVIDASFDLDQNQDQEEPEKPSKTQALLETITKEDDEAGFAKAAKMAAEARIAAAGAVGEGGGK